MVKKEELMIGDYVFKYYISLYVKNQQFIHHSQSIKYKEFH